MTNALLRHLAELPNAQTGLSLTETLALQLLEETGTITAGKLFGRYMREREPLPWLGDLMFWAIIKELINARLPLIKVITENSEWPLQQLCITDIGQQVLNGKLNYLTLMKSPRWVGGICTPVAADSNL